MVDVFSGLGVAGPLAEDLLGVRAALNGSGVPFILFRTADGRPGVAVDRRCRAAVERALDDALEAGLSWETTAPEILRVTGVVEGPRAKGVELEFWEYRGDVVRCPRVNAVTRRVFARSDVEPTSVEALGCSWPTLAGMFERHSGDVDFDIDLVFSWVDGSDPEYRARRARHLSGAVVGEGDDADARMRQIDELCYALRSVHRFAPWVRRIFIATDSALPQWLSRHPRITVVRAEDHFSDRRGLPTYNSHAVESQLQHIDGLAEHFLYSNDDMFFARPVRPSMFFTAGGVSKFVEAGTRIGPGANNQGRSGFENAARVNRELLRQRFGHVITRHLEHTPAPLRRSVLLELEAAFASEFACTRDSRFRSSTDISVTNSLYHYYALFTGRAVPNETARMRYVDTTSHAGLALLDQLAHNLDADPAEAVDFFCLNDGSFPEVDEPHRVAAVSDFLAEYFPEPAPWERTADRPRLLPAPEAVAPDAA